MNNQDGGMTTKSQIISVTVKSSGYLGKLFLVKQNATFGEFKIMLSETFGVVMKMCLICAGRILKDTESFASQNINNGATIHLIIKSLQQPKSFKYCKSDMSRLYRLAGLKTLVSILKPRDSLDLQNQVLFIMKSIIANNQKIDRLIKEANNKQILYLGNRCISQKLLCVCDRFIREMVTTSSNKHGCLLQNYNCIYSLLQSIINNVKTSIITDNPQRGKINQDPLPNPWTYKKSTQSKLKNQYNVQELMQKIISNHKLIKTIAVSGNKIIQADVYHPHALYVEVSKKIDSCNKHICASMSQLIKQIEHIGTQKFFPNTFTTHTIVQLQENIIRLQFNDDIENQIAFSEIAAQWTISAEPDFQYQHQLNILEAIGFSNRNLSRQALDATLGDMFNAIILMLLNI